MTFIITESIFFIEEFSCNTFIIGVLFKFHLKKIQGWCSNFGTHCILDKIFYNDNRYIFGLNKFNELVNESGYYISQEKIRFYYKNQEITQL